MFIIHVVPLLAGTEITMSPSRHLTLCWMVSLIHGGPGAGPAGPASRAALTSIPQAFAPRRCSQSTDTTPNGSASPGW